MNIGRHLGFLLKHNSVCHKADTYVSFDSVESIADVEEAPYSPINWARRRTIKSGGSLPMDSRSSKAADGSNSER